MGDVPGFRCVEDERTQETRCTSRYTTSIAHDQDSEGLQYGQDRCLGRPTVLPRQMSLKAYSMTKTDVPLGLQYDQDRCP